MKKNILIIGNSYESKTLLYNLDYLLNVKIGNVFLLNENHNYSDFNRGSYNFNIELKSNLEECFSACDICLLLDEKSTASKSLLELKTKCKHFDKKIILVEGNADNPNVPVFDINKQPIILLISTGIYEQLYCSEILLSKIFTEHGIDILQIPSVKTQHIFSCLKKNNLLNVAIENTLFQKPQLLLLTLEENFIRYDVESANFYLNLMKIKPDFIILAKNSRVDINSQVFQTRFGKKLDYIINSEFDPMYFWNDISVPLFCKKEDTSINTTGQNEDVSNISDSLLPQLLYNRIISKLTMPKDIELI